MPAMTYYPQAVKMEQPDMNRPGVNAWLGDVAVSTDEDKTIAAGFFHLKKSDQPLVYHYTYHEMKCIVEGEMTISDEEGNVAHAKVGDVFYFPAGSTITFETDSYGVGFFCGQRREGEG